MKGGLATLGDMKKKRELRERRQKALSRLEAALAAASSLGLRLNK
jgi:hypothetical protein